MDKIFVVCPANTVTGGAELLHQLVHELRQINRDAYISYWPFTQMQVRISSYLKYDSPVQIPEDETGNTVILPEVLTRSIMHFKNAELVIWWLSVDNYFDFPQNHRINNPLTYHGNRLYDPLRRLRGLWRIRRPLSALRKIAHFTQSHYALDFLNRRGIKGKMLTDYLSDEHFVAQVVDCERQDFIVYNPKKGMQITTRLIEKFPQLKFVPIQNMTQDQVAALLRTSKLYIDFGHHPGKDRPPREAVLAGCCVVTGQSGAAAFEKDTPIPNSYRLDPYASDFLQKFERVVDEIFRAFSTRSQDFEDWRKKISCERALFKSQVKQLFG